MSETRKCPVCERPLTPTGFCSNEREVFPETPPEETTGDFPSRGPHGPPSSPTPSTSPTP